MNKAENLVAEAAERVEKEGRGGQRGDGYLGEDGLLRCAACHGKRQTRVYIPIVGLGERIVHCACECEQEAYRRGQRQRENQEKQRKVDALVRYSLMDEKFKSSSFDGFEPTKHNRAALKIAQEYVERFDEMRRRGTGLLLYGEPGTGKTYLAACIARELIKAQVPVIATSMVKLTTGSKGAAFGDEDERIISAMGAAELLVIDDLGSEAASERKAERVYNFVDSRYRSGKPLIVTTNLTLQQMKGSAGMAQRRIYERIFEMCYPVEMGGSSWRMRKAAQQYEQMADWLGG